MIAAVLHSRTKELGNTSRIMIGDIDGFVSFFNDSESQIDQDLIPQMAQQSNEKGPDGVADNFRQLLSQHMVGESSQYHRPTGLTFIFIFTMTNLLVSRCP